MIFERVTITGADDSVKVRDLELLSARFPFVEWGILVSKSHEGSPRYPSAGWMEQLRERAIELPADVFAVSMHICGRWVRDIMAGHLSLEDDHPGWLACFPRVQLNFHGEPQDPAGLAELMLDMKRPLFSKETIFQVDGNDRNRRIFTAASKMTPRAVGLFDLSGGRGLVPAQWPTPPWEAKWGYAGGLGPENLAEQLPLIDKAAGANLGWIDMETRVRSADDRQLDLAKVERCLEIVAQYVSGQERA
ncbi:MAG: hypothetical protein ABFE07_28085 [Armatimonadia bacterium]